MKTILCVYNIGLRWGDYLGSPSSLEPSLGWLSANLKDKDIAMMKYVKSPRGDYVVSLGSNNDLFASVIKNRGNFSYKSDLQFELFSY